MWWISDSIRLLASISPVGSEIGECDHPTAYVGPYSIGVLGGPWTNAIPCYLPRQPLYPVVMATVYRPLLHQVVVRLPTVKV